MGNFVADTRDRYQGQPEQRKLMFMDLLELQVPALMQVYQWRSKWLATGDFPDSVRVPAIAVQEVWSAINVCMEPAERQAPAPQLVVSAVQTAATLIEEFADRISEPTWDRINAALKLDPDDPSYENVWQAILEDVQAEVQS